MNSSRALIAWGVGGLGLAGTVFTLALTGDIPGVWGLAALASLPLGGIVLAAADRHVLIK